MKFFYLCCPLFWMIFVYAQDTKLPLEKEIDLVDFTHVKNVLKKDGLLKEAHKKEKEVKSIQKIREDEVKKLYFWPTEEDFFPWAMEFWLVKKASVLHWDFDHPDYGLNEGLESLLKKMGFIQKSFRILPIDAPHPAHLGLPWKSGEYCLLISIPFARAMDLSKLEMSLLMLEDILRLDEKWLVQSIMVDDIVKLYGSNFQNTKPNISVIHALHQRLDLFIEQKGFSFQQQFQITKKMDQLLRPYPELLNTYVRLLGKMDRLIKSNIAFKSLTQLYPSPEMQMKWLAPEEKPL